MGIINSASGSLGSKATALSSADDLLTAPLVVVSEVPPTHTPQVAIQIAFPISLADDLDGMYVWVAGAWKFIDYGG